MFDRIVASEQVPRVCLRPCVLPNTGSRLCLFRVFSLSPLIVRDDSFYRIWTARFAHSLCRYVSVRLYVEKRHEIKFKRALFSFDVLDAQSRENTFRLIDLSEFLFFRLFLVVQG